MTNSFVIDVPGGKSIKFFRALHSIEDTFAPCEFERGGVKIPGAIWDNAEYDGPLKIELTAPVAVSYFFTEDFLALPDVSLLQGPTGGFEVSVQKSLDLTNWFPVVIHRTEADQKAFYRLKLSR